MIAGGLIVMALMMGVMFLGGHHMGKKHSHQTEPPPVSVSSTTSVSTAAVQSPVSPGAPASEPEHSH